MAEPKTKPSDASVSDFLDAIPNDQVRKDCWEILEIMHDITQAEPVMWGDSIIGFGTYHYIYKSGREGDWPIAAFSPRKQNITLYIMSGFDQYDQLLGNLGKYTTSKSCLYIKRLSDVHKPTLVKLIQESVDYMTQIYARK
jgi:hypothetical protein